MLVEPLALKYRPKKLSEIVGQEVIVKIIENSFKSKDLHHAYILSGNFGCGKTSLCRIFAAMENCVNGPTLEPCGKCKNCKDIFSGISRDVKEIDAASNRGIDSIRALKDDIMYVPVDCRSKYIILDECQSITPEAAQAALKMIEEPPPNVRFIFLTTSIESIIPTIKSRCINLSLATIHWTKLYEHLKFVSKQEKIQIEDDALKLIAKKSSGSVRNSLQSLQMVLAFSGQESITITTVQKVLGTVDDSLYYKFVQNIVDLNTAGAFKIINQIMLTGSNITNIIEDLQTHLHNLLIVAICKDENELNEFGFTDDDIKKMTFQVQKAKPALVSYMLGAIIDIQRAISLNLDPQSYLEKFTIDSIIEFVKSKKVAN